MTLVRLGFLGNVFGWETCPLTKNEVPSHSMGSWSSAIRGNTACIRAGDTPKPIYHAERLVM